MRGGILETIKMQCLQVNISDRYIYPTNGFYSVSSSSGHVDNWYTKVFIYSCNIPHFTMRRTQAKNAHFNCRKWTRGSHFRFRTFNVRTPIGRISGILLSLRVTLLPDHLPTLVCYLIFFQTWERTAVCCYFRELMLLWHPRKPPTHPMLP